MVISNEEQIIKVLFCGVIVVTHISMISAATTNLTCYQCEKHNEEECDLQDLKPCASSFDRCAIQFEKNAQEVLTIKRLCGLAPCGFDDEMMEKGLGMKCDRSRDSYSCVSCCRQSGCNKNMAFSRHMPSLLWFFGLAITYICHLRFYIAV